MNESILEDLCRKRDYLAEAPKWLRTVVPNQEALKWLVKANRHALSEYGALARIGRDDFVVKSRFPEAVKKLKGLDKLLLSVARSDDKHHVDSSKDAM
jgi:hypothetical protein